MDKRMKLKFAYQGTFNKYYCCPICKEDISELGINQHIIARAKSELWEREFFNRKKAPYLDIVKKFGKTKFKKVLILELTKL